MDQFIFNKKKYTKFELKEEWNLELEWLKKILSCKELYMPFILNKDIEYSEDLNKKFDLVLNYAKQYGADKECIKIIKDCNEDVNAALNAYYDADLLQCNRIIEKLIRDVSKDSFALSSLYDSNVFPGIKETEIQFFRCRNGEITLIKDTKDMLHLPKNLRSKSGNYRFSIPGNPSLYLSNTSYGCWIETGNPDDNHFNVSPVLLDCKQKILNLAVSTHNLLYIESLDNEEREKKVYCWLKLFMLNIATSYRIEESGRTFKSEYIISQAIMMACKRLGYDGLAYYSRRVSNINFALCAINLVLFVSYNGEYSELLNHIKIDKPTNFSLFNKLSLSRKYSNYELRIQQAHLIAVIGDHDKQYSYFETDFYNFDKFLYSNWKRKDDIPWGVKE